MAQNYKYKAFISYSHADRRWANWLHRRLESYRTPTRLRGTESRLGKVPARLSPVFKDREDLAASHNLSESIRDSLSQSENLIVICSRSSARSLWVNKEIEFFKQLGRSQHVHCLIVDGSPVAGSEADCFPPALRQFYDDRGTPQELSVEPIAADVRSEADGRSLALLKLIAALLGVELDDLRRRELQRRNRRLALLASASVVVSAVMFGLAIDATLARNEARQRQQQAEELLGFMVGDLRQSLQPIGRLDLLESVSQQAENYFATVAVETLSDAELLRQAEVLTQLGEIRLEQLDYTDALELFSESLERSSRLYQLDPADGERLFNRSQAEYWVGFVAWRSGNMSEARRWMNQYLQSALALYDLDPARDAWLREVGYGFHNMAVINSETGALEEAINGFVDEIAILDQMLARAPDTAVMRDLADARSWLGNVYFAQGDVIQALDSYRLAEQRIREVYQRQPENATRIQDLAFAIELVAYHEAITANLEEAADSISASIDLFRQVVARDGSNRNSIRGLNKSEMTQAYILAAQGLTDAAAASAQRIRTSMQLLVDADNADHNVRHLIAQSNPLLAWLELRAGRHEGATEYLNGVEAGLREIAELTPLNDERKGMLASSLIMRGSVYAAGGDASQAMDAWQQAEQLLAPAVAGSESPWLLDPWARLLAVTDRESESAAVIAALTARQYVPLLGWSLL